MPGFFSFLTPRKKNNLRPHAKLFLVGKARGGDPGKKPVGFFFFGGPGYVFAGALGGDGKPTKGGRPPGGFFRRFLKPGFLLKSPRRFFKKRPQFRWNSELPNPRKLHRRSQFPMTDSGGGNVKKHPPRPGKTFWAVWTVIGLGVQGGAPPRGKTPAKKDSPVLPSFSV